MTEIKTIYPPARLRIHEITLRTPEEARLDEMKAASIGALAFAAMNPVAEQRPDPPDQAEDFISPELAAEIEKTSQCGLVATSDEYKDVPTEVAAADILHRFDVIEDGMRWKVEIKGEDRNG